MSSTEDTNRDERRLDALARARLLYIYIVAIGKTAEAESTGVTQ